jgi:NTP pyrophosphatase (non-canonical NTP hydrolase)
VIRYTDLDQTINLVTNEMRSSAQKHPFWPSDPFHALAILGEEMGELHQAVLQHVYEPGKQVTLEDVRGEAIQLAAMAIEFACQLEAMSFSKGTIHGRTIEP